MIDVPDDQTSRMVQSEIRQAPTTNRLMSTRVSVKRSWRVPNVASVSPTNPTSATSDNAWGALPEHSPTRSSRDGRFTAAGARGRRR